MIQNGIPVKQPAGALGYNLLTACIASVVMLGAAYFLFSLGSVDSTQTVNGVQSTSTIPTGIPSMLLVVLAILIPIYTIVYFN